MIFYLSGCGVSPGAQLGDGERHPGGRRHDGEADAEGGWGVSDGGQMSRTQTMGHKNALYGWRMQAMKYLSFNNPC